MSKFADMLKIVESTRRHELARQHVARSLFRFVKVQAVSRTTGKPWAAPFVKNITIRVAAGYSGANGNHYWGLFEPPDMAFLLHYLRPDSLFADAGANVGSYTLLASGAVGCQTVAFEPVPSTITRLKQNISDNGLNDRVEVRPVCLGAENGNVRFTTDADTMNEVILDNSRPSIEVPVRRLDQELGESPTLIKIDTEGFDDKVLMGCEGLLGGTAGMAILIETLGGAHTGRTSDEVKKWLSHRGFQPAGYDLFRRRITAREESPTRNHLFVRGMEEAQSRVNSAPSFSIPGFLDI